MVECGQLGVAILGGIDVLVHARATIENQAVKVIMVVLVLVLLRVLVRILVVSAAAVIA